MTDSQTGNERSLKPCPLCELRPWVLAAPAAVWCCNEDCSLYEVHMPSEEWGKLANTRAAPTPEMSTTTNPADISSLTPAEMARVPDVRKLVIREFLQFQHDLGAGEGSTRYYDRMATLPEVRMAVIEYYREHNKGWRVLVVPTEGGTEREG